MPLDGFDLPPTYDEFRDKAFAMDRHQLPAGGEFLRAVIQATDAGGECAVCGNGIVSAEGLAEAVAEHYGLDYEASNALAYDLMNESTDFDFTDGITCGYHSNRD